MYEMLVKRRNNETKKMDRFVFTLFYFNDYCYRNRFVYYAHGRVAYFTGWTFLGLGKDEWDNLHVIFGFLMVFVAIWHIILNWKPLKKYIFQKESLYALIIVGIIIFGTIKNIQPFKAVSDFENYIKNSWEVNKIGVPIAHGELLTLKEFCKRLGIPLSKAEKILQNEGIKFNESQTLKEIAKLNNTTPVAIYEKIKNLQKNEMTFVPGSGIGRMTLEEFCKKYNINLKKALNILKRKGINAKKDQTLREIAFSHNLTPIDIAQMLKNQ
jgi:predicted transcriptional regulator